MFRRFFLLLFLSGLVSAAFAAARPNVVLVTLEGARADRMGFLGAKGGLTPNLDSLARHGVVFENAYAQAPLTTVSHATILTGLYPQTHGVTEFGSPLVAKLPYLPDILHNAGYRTAAFINSRELNPRQGYAPGFMRGFDSYIGPTQVGSRLARANSTSASMATRATQWLGNGGTKASFLWLELDCGTTAYDRGIASCDAAFGKLITALNARKLTADSLIVVTADHGESLGSHGEDGHGIFLYDETIHVPLLIKLPKDQLAGKAIAARVQLVDIAPAVLELSGVAVPAAMQGASLAKVASGATAADRPAYARTQYPNRAFGWSMLESWRSGKYLLIRAPHPELYDLGKDPDAQQNLTGSLKATLDTLAGQLDSFDKRLAGTASSEAQLSSSEIQKLASLGYVGLQQHTTASATVTGDDPKDKIAIANAAQKALVQIEAGQAQAGLTALQAIVKQNDKAYLVHYVLGLGYIESKQYSKAVEALRRAIGLLPDSARANYEMAVALAATGNWKDAATHLEIVVGRLPEFADAHRLLADAYTHLGRAQDAQRERGKLRQ